MGAFPSLQKTDDASLLAPLQVMMGDMTLDRSSKQLEARLQGISIAGFEKFVAAAGGRWRLKKGVGAWTRCDTVCSVLTTALITCIIVFQVLIHNYGFKVYTAGADPKQEDLPGIWFLAFFFPLLGVFFARMVYVGYVIDSLGDLRSDVRPSIIALVFPCLVPWVYVPKKTTENIKRDFVLPATTNNRVSYAELLQAHPESSLHVGEATVFVSHSYNYLFLDVVDALSAWAARHPRPDGKPHYFYFDLFINSQHGQPVIPFSELRHTFSINVRSTEQFLLLLDMSLGSKALPDALTRSWCIFEIATALSCGKPIEVITPPINEELLKDMFQPSDSFHLQSMDHLLNLMCSIDVETAKSTQPLDQVNIRRIIMEDLGGFLAVNQLVIGAMRDWIAKVGLKVLKSMPENNMEAYYTLADCMIGLLRDQGKFDEAIQLCRGELESRREKLGINHKDSLSAKNSLLYLLKATNKGADVAELEAESVRLELQQHYEECRKSYGDDHTNTLAAQHSYLDNFPLNDLEATTAHSLLLGKRRKTLGDSHPDTLLTAQSLVARLLYQERGEEARAVQPQPQSV